MVEHCADSRRSSSTECDMMGRSYWAGSTPGITEMSVAYGNGTCETLMRKRRAAMILRPRQVREDCTYAE